MRTDPELPPLLVVFYANPDYYPPTINAVRILRRHFRVTVVCRNVDDPIVSWPEDVVIERVGPPATGRAKIEAPAAEKAREIAGFIAAVRRAIVATRPVVVYAYENYALVATFAAARLASLGPPPPVVYHMHEMDELDRIRVRGMQGAVLKLSLRLSPRAAVVVVPEKNRAAYYARFVRDPRPPVVTPNFPHPELFPPPADWDALLARRRRTRQILYRGIVGADSGVREAVLAVARLDPSVSFRVCGPRRPELGRELDRIVAEEGLGDRVRFDGYVPYERMNRETPEATVGVMLYQKAHTDQKVHTNWEYSVTAANKSYEYAASGVPVVLPDRPSFREFLGGERWVELAEASDPSAIAAAFRRVLDDEAGYEARCRAARRAFEERFNYEVSFQPLLARILEMADRTVANRSARSARRP